MPVPFLNAATPTELLGWTEAIDALERALRSGLDPTATTPRTITPIAGGQLLTMPAACEDALGVKLVTVANEGMPRIKGLYVLFDPETLAPALLLDGAVLTLLRTAAQSALAVRHLAAPDASHLVVFGSGPQAGAHIEAVRAVRPIERVTVVARNPTTAADVVRRSATHVPTVLGAPEAIAEADIVVCATTARAPVFAGERLAANACVIAIGAHEPDAREIDDTVLWRAQHVVVEDRDTALRENGNIVQAIAAGALAADDLLPMKDILDHGRRDGIAVFTGVGMGWQDVVVAAAVRERNRRDG